MRENAATKARRYLVEGRVLLERVDRHVVMATARGDGAVHLCSWTPAKGWSCSCPARGRCCHLLAVGLVVAVDLETGR